MKNKNNKITTIGQISEFCNKIVSGVILGKNWVRRPDAALDDLFFFLFINDQIYLTLFKSICNQGKTILVCQQWFMFLTNAFFFFFFFFFFLQTLFFFFFFFFFCCFFVFPGCFSFSFVFCFVSVKFNFFSFRYLFWSCCNFILQDENNFRFFAPSIRKIN